MKDRVEQIKKLEAQLVDIAKLDEMINNVNIAIKELMENNQGDLIDEVIEKINVKKRKLIEIRNKFEASNKNINAQIENLRLGK